MTTRLCGEPSRQTLDEIRHFVRQSGIERPKLNRWPVPGYSHPTVIFTFKDADSAFYFRMRFGFPVLADGDIPRHEEARRARIEEGIKLMDLPPHLEAYTREVMIHGLRPEVSFTGS